MYYVKYLLNLLFIPSLILITYNFTLIDSNIFILDVICISLIFIYILFILEILIKKLKKDLLINNNLSFLSGSLKDEFKYNFSVDPFSKKTIDIFEEIIDRKSLILANISEKFLKKGVCNDYKYFLQHAKLKMEEGFKSGSGESNHLSNYYLSAEKYAYWEIFENNEIVKYNDSRRFFPISNSLLSPKLCHVINSLENYNSICKFIKSKPIPEIVEDFKIFEKETLEAEKKRVADSNLIKNLLETTVDEYNRRIIQQIKYLKEKIIEWESSGSLSRLDIIKEINSMYKYPKENFERTSEKVHLLSRYFYDKYKETMRYHRDDWDEEIQTLHPIYIKFLEKNSNYESRLWSVEIFPFKHSVDKFDGKWTIKIDDTEEILDIKSQNK